MILLTDEQCEAGIQRICDMARDIASMSGLVLDRVQVGDGEPLTCKNFHVIQLAAGGKTVSVKIHHEEVAETSSMTEDKIQSAVDRLRLLLEG